MNFTRYIILFLIFLLPLYAQGQPGKYILNGHLHIKDGETYPYQLVFTVSHSAINGYSITKMTDGSETKTTIKGHINRKKQTLSITETKLLSERQKDVIICMVDAKLVYKLRGAKYFIIG